MNEKKPVSNVCYQIAAKNGRVLEVADFNTASGAAVQLWDNVKEDSQIWLLVEVAEGLYKLENKLTGKVLVPRTAHGCTSGIISARTTSSGRWSRRRTAAGRCAPSCLAGCWISWA